MPKRTSSLTDAITEGVERYMDLLHEIIGGEWDVAMLERKVDQRSVREQFLAAQEDENKRAAFIQQFGEEEYARQALLHFQNVQRKEAE